MAEVINGLADQQPADPLMALFGQIDAQYARLEGIESPEEYDRILADIEVALPPQQRGSQLTIEAVPAVDPNHTPLSQQHFDERASVSRTLPVDHIEDDTHPMGEDYPDGDIGVANRAERVQRVLDQRANRITGGPELDALRRRNDRINAQRQTLGQESDQDHDDTLDEEVQPTPPVVPVPPLPVARPVPPPPPSEPLPRQPLGQESDQDHDDTLDEEVQPTPPPSNNEPDQPVVLPTDSSTASTFTEDSARNPSQQANLQPASSPSPEESQEAAPEKASFEPDRVAFDQALTRYGYTKLLSEEIVELDHQLQRLRGRELRAFDYDKFVAAWVRRMREGQAQDSEDQSPTPPSLDVARKGTQSVVDGVGYGRDTHHEEGDDEGGFDDEGRKSPEDMSPAEIKERIQELEASIPAVETVAAEYDTNVEANRKKLERMWEAFVDAGNDEKVAEVERLLNAITLSEEMRDKNKPQQ